MISPLRAFIKSIPTLILSLALAIAVWISAVSADDPIQQRAYPRTITIEWIGQSPTLVVAGEVPTQVSVTLSAPSSIWDRMLSDRAPVRAWIELTGLGPGVHTLEVKIQTQIQPVKIVNQSPKTVTITLEELATQEYDLAFQRTGEPAVGFQADTPTLSQTKVKVSGPASLVKQVKTARVTLSLQQASENINRKLAVQVLDEDEKSVEGVTVTPGEVTVSQPISQRGGYRNVVIKVASSGQVATGYRLTNISVFPPNVTVFSTNPSLVDKLPGFVETSPLDLTGVKDDLEVRLPLNLPNGVEVVGDQTVLVQVGVAAIEGSITLSDLPIQVTGLPNELMARISPEQVDVIVSGPLPLLDSLSENDVLVILDLSAVSEGTYQFAPRVEITVEELKVESILPSSIEVVVEVRPKSTATPVRRPTPGLTPTPSPTPSR
jgi:YbbR domain-containing protein